MHSFPFGQLGKIIRPEASKEALEARNGRRHQTVGQ